MLVALCGCTGGNIGSLSDPSPPGTGGGGGGGGGLGRGPAVAPGDGALSLEGRPRNLAFAPRAGSTGVDVHAPLALWFNESVNLATVNALSVQLRPKGGVGSVAYGVRGYCGDRLVVLTPTANLQTDTVYQVYLSDQLTDLSGQRVRLPNTEGLLGGFRTAAQSSGVAPRVLATFPPDGASSEPNDHAFVIVFSKRIDFTSVSGAVDLQADGLAAAYGLPVGHSNDRVIEFAHLDDELDLGAAMTVEISTDITDTEFVPQNLAEAYSAAWTTFGLARPSGIDIGAEAAANLGNLDAFPTNVAVGASALVTDVAHLEVWEGLGSDQVSGDQPAVNGPGSVAFVSDLSDGNGAPVLADGLLTIGAFLQRGALRTTFRVQQSFFQDTVRPVLVEFGPPAASIPSRFSTDLPEFRPYGLASEPISAVEVEFAPNPASTRTTLLPSPDKFFLGDAFPLPQVSGGPFAFTARLTDAAGNQMVDPVAGSAVFRGFTGPAPAAGTVSVLAFNARGL
ncbi:MAG: Ig-like domain-containing protein, partial [Planctomycetes bacterium]|nr:Ig-like domain-containing protein [Planctomycetota bacterium]